jgi:uncharacterized metal-binding protein YceD (DUF177 family)
VTGTGILSEVIDPASIPAAGIERRITASDAERAALAEACGLIEVRSLAAAATLGRGQGNTVAVDGRVRAEIVQTCVVSLEPVVQAIDKPFQVRFAPPDARPRPATRKAASEVVVDPTAPDPPEILDPAGIDLGAIVEEHFVLAIDPYPRAANARLPGEPGDPVAPGEDSPFAVLASLKQDRGRAG